MKKRESVIVNAAAAAATSSSHSDIELAIVGHMPRAQSVDAINTLGGGHHQHHNNQYHHHRHQQQQLGSALDDTGKRKSALTQWQKEKILLQMNYKMLLLCLVWQYVHSVATNVAYYLHVQRQTLSDLGFGLLPALPKNVQVISEIMFFICLFSTIAFILSPIFYPRRNLYFALILTRFAGTLVLAQTLRIVCFLVTTLPGPNYHCRPESVNYAPPKSLWDIFGRQDAFFGCGDLVFSSHTIFVVLCALIWHKYCPYKWVRRIVWFLVFIFGLLVVAARKHYSLDIMVAWYTVPLLWVAYDHYFPDRVPVDFDPYPGNRIKRGLRI